MFLLAISALGAESLAGKIRADFRLFVDADVRIRTVGATAVAAQEVRADGQFFRRYFVRKRTIGHAAGAPQETRANGHAGRVVHVRARLEFGAFPEAREEKAVLFVRFRRRGLLFDLAGGGSGDERAESGGEGGSMSDVFRISAMEDLVRFGRGSFQR